ncbi:hypothetical protein BDB00DRAFT_870221 [Zychaea mexicana]|uniref:uncharacterized protein n=1 Tax=Zychaea mexicana TaxID=64656 RepID=UPI0022FF03A2|nr:uncharacterized protein BDB00DRAFT_870221 [Zychaea mexicana]KAI9495674.1 hypothetical protein BDB00DRAFT_870221 [Zychaea mexicana]
MPLPFFCFTRDIYETKFDVMMPAAAKASEASLGNALVALRQSLQQCMDDNAGEQAAYTKLQSTIKAMRKAQREAKYEIVIAYYAPAWYKPLKELFGAFG